MPDHEVVSREQWIERRKQLMEREKSFTRERDRLSAERRALPWVKVEKEYVFDGPGGKQTLAELFEGRSQLAVYHFMFGPDWEEGCKSCSFWADNYDRLPIHLAHRDVSLVAISRAPLEKLEAYRQRLGWSFKWVSSHGTDFNRDFHVTFTPEELERGEAYYNYSNGSFPSEEAPGFSAFYRDANGGVFHTYSCYARGLDMMNAAYHILDMMPKGRDEDALPYPMDWLRIRDRYED